MYGEEVSTSSFHRNLYSNQLQSFGSPLGGAFDGFKAEIKTISMCCFSWLKKEGDIESIQYIRGVDLKKKKSETKLYIKSIQIIKQLIYEREGEHG